MKSRTNDSLVDDLLEKEKSPVEKINKAILYKNEECYRAFINSSVDMAFLKDENLKYLIVNRSCASFFNRSESDIIGKSDFEVMPEDAVQNCYQSDIIALNSDKLFIHEEIVGEKIYESRKFRVLLHDNTYGVGGFICDITDRKFTEIALRESEGFYADLIANQIAGVYRIIIRKPNSNQTIWDTLAYEFVSDRFCDIIGIEKSMISKMPASIIRNAIHPDDRLGFILANEEANRDLITFSWEGRIVFNNTSKWIRFDSNPRKLDDESIRWTGVIIDITNQKKVEEMLKKNSDRLMRLNDCLSSLGPDSAININSLTALCGELLTATFALYYRIEKGYLYTAGKWQVPKGYKERDIPDGQLCYDVIRNNNEKATIINNLSETCYAKTDPNIIAYSLQTYCGQVVRNEGIPVGSICVVYDNDYQLNDEDRRIIGIIGSAIGNEDNRMRRNEALKASESKLKDLNATKDKFFSIIAHDLKSPFNGILGFSKILKEEAGNLDISTIIDYAEMINDTALQTNRLLDNLLSWASIQQGKISFKPVTNILYPVANEVIHLFQDIAARKKITIINMVPDQLIAKADTEMLKTILRNLISNALKFTGINGTICINATTRDSGTDIVVTDNGAGIKAADISKFFNMGIAFSKHGTENEKGTGLGLILCKEFIEKHGGSLSVESNFGIGSKFMFNLPDNSDQSFVR